MIKASLNINLEKRRKVKVRKRKTRHCRINKQIHLPMRNKSLDTHVWFVTTTTLHVIICTVLKWIRYLNNPLLSLCWLTCFPVRRPIWLPRMPLPLTQFWWFPPQSWNLMSWWPLQIRNMVMWIHWMVKPLINMTVKHHPHLILFHPRFLQNLISSLWRILFVSLLSTPIRETLKITT